MNNTMQFGEKEKFAVVIEPLQLPLDEAISSAARSLARLEIWCQGNNLCVGHDEEGKFESLEIPLIDLATWLIEGWEERRNVGASIPLSFG